ncbi:MAG: hypothetical protein ACM3O3_13030 [Syntrophothermus sp.]
MSKFIFHIELRTIKLINRELLEKSLTKKGILNMNKVNKIADMLIQEIENATPDNIKKEFYKGKINIQVDYNQVRNTVMFIIDWNKQSFKKHGVYEVITDFNNFFVQDFKQVLTDYNESLRKKSGYYTQGFCTGF